MFCQFTLWGFESNTILISSLSMTCEIKSDASEINNLSNCSENARKDLEIKFNRLMKERNEWYGFSLEYLLNGVSTIAVSYNFY